MRKSSGVEIVILLIMLFIFIACFVYAFKIYIVDPENFIINFLNSDWGIAISSLFTLFLCSMFGFSISDAKKTGNTGRLTWEDEQKIREIAKTMDYYKYSDGYRSAHKYDGRYK